MARAPLSDVVVPLVIGAGAAIAAEVVRRLSEGGRTVRRVGEAAGGAVLFELEDLEETADQALQPAPGWAAALGVFDLETTGVDPASARIVTAHVGVIDELGQVVERHEWIVDPGIPIPAGAVAIHGVATARAQRFGRAPAEVVPEILGAIRSVFVRGFPLVVYNAPYDLTLLDAEAVRLGLAPLDPSGPIVDPLVIDRAVDRYRRGKRTLTATAAAYGVELIGAHDAGADAIAAGRVAQAIARRYGAELGVSAAELHESQVGWCADQAQRFQTYMRDRRDPGFTTNGGWPRR